jgi:hypothetical protein
MIMPSDGLIVVRFGASHGPGGDAEGVGALVRDVIAAQYCWAARRAKEPLP